MTDQPDWTVPLRWDPARGFLAGGDYEVRVRLGVLRGRLEVVGLSIGSLKTNKAISSDLLRKVRVAEAAQKAAEVLALEMAGWTGQPLNLADMDDEFRANRAAFVAPLLAAAPLAEQRARGGPYPPGHLKRVAEIYTAAHALRQSPRQAVATALGITPEAAGKQVYLARKAGLLPPTTSGKATAKPKRIRKAQP